MKQIAIILLVLVMCLSVCACGQPSSASVPEQQIEMFIKDGDFYQHHFQDGRTMSYKVRTLSNDKASHTQELEISVSISGTYGEVTSSACALFQYDKSSDLWTMIRSANWEDPVVKYNSKLVGTYNETTPDGSTYSVTIKSVQDGIISASCSIHCFCQFHPFTTNRYETFVDIAGSTDSAIQKYYDISIPASVSDGYEVAENQITVLLDISEGVRISWLPKMISISEV